MHKMGLVQVLGFGCQAIRALGVRKKVKGQRIKVKGERRKDIKNATLLLKKTRFDFIKPLSIADISRASPIPF